MLAQLTLQHWLEAQPFTLTLSGGYFSHYVHCAILTVLEEEQLWPQRVTGASAGALAGVCWASGSPAGELRQAIFTHRRSDFWDFYGWGSLLKGEKLVQHIARLVTTQELEGCRWPVAVSVRNKSTGIIEVWNKGNLVEAVYASCAMPFFFKPFQKNGQYFDDGAMLDRPGLAGTEPGERIFYHHIVQGSPWRLSRAEIPSPTRPNMVTLKLDGLTQVGPTDLPAGVRAYWQAYHTFRHALTQPIKKQEIRLTV